MLNRHELIYEDRETGTRFQGLYYVDLDKPSTEPRQLTASVQSIREFVTSSGLRFSMIRDALMTDGHYASGIHLLRHPAAKDKSFQITNIISVFNNEGCATSEPASGCGKLSYGLLLSDSSGRQFEIKSNGPPALIVESGSMHLKKDAVTLEFPMGLQGDNFLMLRYRLQKNPPGFFLNNWDKTIDQLKKVTNTMAKPSHQQDAPQGTRP